MKYKLEDICIKITDGSHYSPIDDPTSSIPMLSVKDMEEFDFNYNNCKHISEEEYNKMLKNDCVPKLYDVLVAKDGSYLKEIFVNSKENKKAILSSIAIFRPNQDIVDPYFLCYLLKTPMILSYVKDNCVSGSALPRIILRAFKGIELMIPEIKIQRRIVKIIKNINDKIKINNEINNNLHELEKNLYKEYFKDLSDDNTKKLGELCNIKYGKGLPTTKIEKEGYPVYGGNGIIGYYHEFMYDNSQVLISCRGAASGNVIVSKPKSFVTNNSLILECDRKYHYYLKQYSLDNYYYEYTTGSAQPQITIDNIKDIVLSIPSDELLESFNKQMENLELKYFSNLEEISKLEQLRDTLLPKLMNGEIDLENIES